MLITYFIRDNNNSYPELCDIASAKLIKNKKTFYYGTMWGEHNPTGAIERIVVNAETFNLSDWLKSLGYEPVIEEAMQ